jgi:hypothetical protein
MLTYGVATALIMSSDIHVLKDALELLPGLRPLPFFTHVELFTKGFFLPPDCPDVIVEWVHQVCVCVCMRACVRVCERESARMCLYEREREREKERARESVCVRE